MKTSAETDPTEAHVTIKLGSEAHAKWFYLARQVDGLLCFVAKQQRLALEAFICYESSGAR
jgi:hypothetical protein